MTSRERNGFLPYGISDTHLHLVYPRRIEDTLALFRNFIEYFEYDSVTLCALTRSGHRPFDPVNNLKALYCKSVLNAERPGSVYVYGSTLHMHDEWDTAEGYLCQVRTLAEMGVDGYKLLDGKPGRRKAIGRPLSDPIFDPMYAFIEAAGLPLKMHLADPAKYWGDKSLLSDYAIMRGWYYGDGTFPSLDDLRREAREILEKFPKLKLCLAHFGYMADSYEYVCELFERFPYLSFDLTPGASMFLEFNRRREEWMDFFRRYGDRIFFGTDTYNNASPTDAPGNYERELHNLVRRMLERSASEPYEHPDLGTLYPLGLPEDLLKRIYTENQRALLGDPRPLCREAILREALRVRATLLSGEYRMPSEEELSLELMNLDVIIRHFA